MNTAVPGKPPRGPIAEFFVGLWNVMNFTRRLIVNILFFGLLLFFVILVLAIAGAGGTKPLLEDTALVIEPTGPLVEQYTADPAELNAVIEAAMAESSYLDFSVQRGLLTHGFATPVDLVRGMAPYTNVGFAGKITCPCLICEAENDVRGGDAKPLYDAITAPKTYLLFTNEEGAGEHDEAGAATLFSQRVFDWLDETLAGGA